MKFDFGKTVEEVTEYYLDNYDVKYETDYRKPNLRFKDRDIDLELDNRSRARDIREV